MSPRFCTPLAIALAIAAPARAASQQLLQQQVARTEPAGNAALIAGGLAGGLAGMFVGAFAGRQIYDPPASCRECTRWGVASGAVIGSVLGLPLGVHLANHGRGDFLTVLGRSAAVMGSFWAASYVSARAGLELDLLIVPAGFAGGLAMAIHTERTTNR